MQFMGRNVICRHGTCRDAFLFAFGVCDEFYVATISHILGQPTCLVRFPRSSARSSNTTTSSYFESHSVCRVSGKDTLVACRRVLR